jgi:hypothetical protein
MAFVIFKELKPKDFDPYENIKVDEDNNAVYVLANFLLFGREVLISAAYSIQKFADVIIDSDGEDFVIFKLVKKEFDGSLEELGREFNNRLINYANYFENLKYNKAAKEQIIGEVYSQLPENEELASDAAYPDIPAESGGDFDAQEMPRSESDSEDTESSDEEKIDEALDEDLEDFDADEILLPWEEKFKEDLKDKNDTNLEKDPEDSDDTK